MADSSSVKSVAVIGAGASGAAAVTALAAEQVFDTIRVFERRETPGGTWIYDPDPGEETELQPGKLPPEIDSPLEIPETLPSTKSPDKRQRYKTTPIYEELTTNVPDIAMSFSDRPFAYGPFVPHWIPRQYINEYFSHHRNDSISSLVLNTTVEDVTRISNDADKSGNHDRWRLTLRRFEPTRNVDEWWAEEFDALILANGHYSVPFIPFVPGLRAFSLAHPNLITHSKTYRTPRLYTSSRVLLIGNSSSGHDIATQLLSSNLLSLPLYISRRSPSWWDGPEPPRGVIWKPTIRSYSVSSSLINFDDGSVLHRSDLDAIIYCTGYKPSYPFWNAEANRGELFDYTSGKGGRLRNSYQHTFFHDPFPSATLGIIGLPRVLTFRSFEYQAVALARMFAGRNSNALPSVGAQEKWVREREEMVEMRGSKFHDIVWDEGETMDWFDWLFKFAGLPKLSGEGRFPPKLGRETRWAIENVRKYPRSPAPGAPPGKGEGEERRMVGEGEEEKGVGEGVVREVEGLGKGEKGWVLVDRVMLRDGSMVGEESSKKWKKDSLHFI